MTGREKASAGSGGYYLVPVLLIFATFATFRRRDLSDLLESGIDTEIKVKLAVWAVLGLVALRRLPVILRNSALLFTLPLAPYAAFCALALFSATYSLEPGLSAVRAGQLAVALALGLSMVDRAPEWTKLGALYLAINWAFLLIGATNAIPGLHLRELPGFQEPGYDGINAPWRLGTPIGHFSIISLVATMLAVAYAARLSRAPTLLDLGYLSWLVLTDILTVSRTGLLGMVLGLLSVLLLRGYLAATVLVTAATVPFLLMTPGLGEGVIGFLGRGQDAADLASLSNRADIYGSALASIGDDWLVGHGFRASRAARLAEVQDNAGHSFGFAAHAHNAVLESTASLGVAGLICALSILGCFLLCALALFRRSQKAPNASGAERRESEAFRPASELPPRSRAVEFCSLWPPILAFSMMDSSFALEINPFVFCFICILLDFTQYRASCLNLWPVSSPRFSPSPGSLQT